MPHRPLAPNRVRRAISAQQPIPSRAVRLVVEDDLERSRLTVFFRFLLALPHLAWLLLWGVVASQVGLINWIITLFTRHPLPIIHRFLAAYLRYTTHVNAYLFLAANPFPGFTGRAGSYPVELRIEGPQLQNRWTVGFRLILAVPALILASAGIGGIAFNTAAGVTVGNGVAATAAFLGWFACLVRRGMPSGLRDLVVYALAYSGQVGAYLFLLTDRYPSSDPFTIVEGYEPAPRQPIRLKLDDDLRRSRLTVFFRLPLSVPHYVWLVLWGIVAFLATIAIWFATLVRGSAPAGLHRFLSAYVRYQTHVMAFSFLVANRFPGFVGRAGSYEVDLEIDPPERQGRWRTGFRLFLALPALFVAGALQNGLALAAFLGWFASLATGRMPQGLRNLGAYALRYSAESGGYLFLLTERYPYSGPPSST